MNRHTVRLALLMLALLLVACGDGEEDRPSPGQIETESNRDGVFTIRGDQREALPAPDQTLLEQGDGVDVDERGRAILRFADLLSVEVLRDGELTVQELSIEDQSAFVTVAQRGGALINDFDPQEVADRRFTIQSDFAIIEATGTRFMVVREEGSPLEWVVAMEANENDLMVSANGMSVPVTTGMARWIAPIGTPSEAISADMAGVDTWIDAVRAGEDVAPLGEYVMPPADVLEDTESLDDLPAPGDPFVLGGVVLTLDPDGLFGAPEYGLEDCNGDGIRDVAIRAGTLTMDFRQIERRVRALDVTVYNRAEADSGSLRVMDPARDEMNRQRLIRGADSVEVLSLRSENPYHYADLSVTDGCLLGLSLTPPNADGTPGEPRPAVEEDESSSRPTETPTAEELRCTVVYTGSDGLNLREGPGTTYEPPIGTVYENTELMPEARNADGSWIFVRVPATNRQGWVSADPQLVSCTVDINTLPVRETPPPPTRASVEITDPGSSDAAVTNGFVVRGTTLVPDEGRLILQVETADGTVLQTQELDVTSGATTEFTTEISVDYELPADVRLRAQVHNAAGEVVAEDTVLIAPLFAPDRVERPAENGRMVALPVGRNGYEPIDIDGEMADWSSLARQSDVEWTPLPATIHGDCAGDATGRSADLDGRVRFAYDQSNLYVAFQVLDDIYTPYTGDDNRVFLGDSVQLLLDTDLERDFRQNVVSGDDIQIDFHAGDVATQEGYEFLTAPRVVLWQLATLESRRFREATIASARSQGSYFVEAALPWEYVNPDFVPEAGTRVGVVADVNDNDTPDANQQECIISTAPESSWQDPTTWGTLVLTGRQISLPDYDLRLVPPLDFAPILPPVGTATPVGQ